ncbi:MAG: immunity 17 family protein [Prosthecobacter sp.]|nr:immunity 17 family protein [Prosthecobacter sp.]
MLLTVFLLSGGLFTLAAALLNWDWFFRHPTAAPVTFILGRSGARVAYACLGLLLAGVGGWRVVSPPATITPAMLQTLTHPHGFSVLEADAASQLRGKDRAGRLALKDGDWTRFEMALPAGHPLHGLLDDTGSFGVDIDPGFLLRHRLRGETIRATLFYFDATLRPCDNFLFSRAPLSSAEFVVVVWDKPASEAFGEKTGLRAVWYRKTDADFAKHASID